MTTRKPSPRHDDPHTGTCFYSCTPTNNRASTPSVSRSSHVAVPDSRERHKGKASGSCRLGLLTRLQPPLLCLRRTVVIARPAAAQTPTGRNHRLRCCLEFGLSQGPLSWLATKLQTGASMLPVPGNHNCLAALAVATIKQTSRFSGFSYGLYPISLQADTMGGQGQGCNVRARCSLSVLLCLFF